MEEVRPRRSDLAVSSFYANFTVSESPELPDFKSPLPGSPPKYLESSGLAKVSVSALPR